MLCVRISLFFIFYISQGRVARYVKCVVRNMTSALFEFFAEFSGQRSLKIGIHLAKLWTNNNMGVFLAHSVYVSVFVAANFILIIKKFCQEVEDGWR